MLADAKGGAINPESFVSVAHGGAHAFLASSAARGRVCQIPLDHGNAGSDFVRGISPADLCGGGGAHGNGSKTPFPFCVNS